MFSNKLFNIITKYEVPFFLPFGYAFFAVFSYLYIAELFDFLNVSGVIQLTDVALCISSLFLIYSIWISHKHASPQKARILIKGLEAAIACILLICEIAFVLNKYLTLPIAYTGMQAIGLTLCLILGIAYVLIITTLAPASAPIKSNENQAQDVSLFPSTPLVIILVGTACILALGLRIWNLDYIQSSDLFNLSAAKAYFDNGHFFYPRNLQLTYLLSAVFKIFEPTLFFARLPLAILGAIAVFLMYFLGSHINRYVGILSSFLLAISPVAIEESTLIREYSENLVIALFAYMVLFKIVKAKPQKYTALALFTVLIVANYTYSVFLHNYTSQLIILVLLFMAIPSALYLIYREKTYLYIVLGAASSFMLVFAMFAQHLFAGFRSYGYEPYWFHAFFQPTIKFPMQWFSSIGLPEIFFIGLFVLPLLFLRSKYLYISYFVFVSLLAVFVFKFDNTLSYVPTRYMYDVYPFYILIFATSIYVCVATLRNSKILLPPIIIGLALIFISPSNILHAAKHDLVVSWPYSSKTQPTSTGSRTDVAGLLEIMQEEGLLSPTIPTVLTDFDPSWLLLQSELTIDPVRSFADKGNYKYEIGSNVYLENDYWQVYDLEQTVRDFPTGIYITRSSRNFQKSPKYNLARFNLLVEYVGFEVYGWQKNSALNSAVFLFQ